MKREREGFCARRFTGDDEHPAPKSDRPVHGMAKQGQAFARSGFDEQMGEAIGRRLAAGGGRRPLWAPSRRYNPRPRLVRTTAFALSTLLVAFGLYGWRLQSTQGPELRLAGQEQMTRCVRLPAPRGARAWM